MERLYAITLLLTTLFASDMCAGRLVHRLHLYPLRCCVLQSLGRYAYTEMTQEILTLLLRIHELEIENIEHKSELYLRDSLLSQQEAVISRFQGYRGIAEEIISQQRELIYGT